MNLVHVAVVKSTKTAVVKMLKPLKIVNYRKYKKHKNIVVWTKMSTMCTQIKNFVDKKVRVIEKIILVFYKKDIKS